MKTIIVPLDFSEESLNGLNMALMMANKTMANITLVYVIDKKISEVGSLLENEIQLRKMKFESILKTCQEKSKYKCGMSYIISTGKIFEDITVLAEKDNESMIVLSTHGESGFEELFIGGNAYKIASHSRKPVITVRKGIIPESIDRIILPLDFTKETREKVPYTINLAKQFGSEIHLITVKSTKLKSIDKKLHQYSNQVAAYLDKYEIPYKIEHLYGGNLADLILEYSNKVKANLISIMSEQEKSMTNLLLGNYAHQMINKSDIPVLTYPTYPLSIVTDDIWTLGEFNGYNADR
jgi:nucleotide-binding universal stress UspA family protein